MLYNQKNTIYEAHLILSNNEWETLQSDYGTYHQRIDYPINLLKLKKVEIYDEHIHFIITDHNTDTTIRIKITSDLFYTLEYEDEYYN